MLKHSHHLIGGEGGGGKGSARMPEIKFERQLLQNFQHNFADPGD